MGMRVFVFLTIQLLGLLSPFAVGSAAAAIPERKAVLALVGEAGGQSYVELKAHAFALRNRGTLRGVYGLRAPHIKRERPSTFDRARRAWYAALSGKHDPVGGRTEWRSDHDLRKLWRQGKTTTSQGLYDPIKIGDTTFFRLSSNNA